MKHGFYTALGTPLNENGELVAAGMTLQVRQQVEAGVSGLLVLGSMGNMTYLKNSTYPKVAACAAGDPFCGVAMAPRCGIAGVQFKGFMTVTCTGELTCGWATLAADGAGGVKAAEQGVSALVVTVNGDGTAVICL